MGVQVTYNMSDLLKDETIDVNIKSKRVGTERPDLPMQGSKKRIWTAVADDAFMGESVTGDILGEYWFENKRNINGDAMDLLLDLRVPFREDRV